MARHGHGLQPDAMGRQDAAPGPWPRSIPCRSRGGGHSAGCAAFPPPPLSALGRAFVLLCSPLPPSPPHSSFGSVPPMKAADGGRRV